MKVRELINQLIDIQSSFNEEVNICIKKQEGEDTTIYVADKNSISISTPREIGDSGVWIEGNIRSTDSIRKSGQIK